jgi:hypothetical protein
MPALGASGTPGDGRQGTRTGRREAKPDRVKTRRRRRLAVVAAAVMS